MATGQGIGQESRASQYWPISAKKPCHVGSDCKRNRAGADNLSATVDWTSVSRFHGRLLLLTQPLPSPAAATDCCHCADGEGCFTISTDKDKSRSASYQGIVDKPQSLCGICTIQITGEKAPSTFFAISQQDPEQWYNGGLTASNLVQFF